MTCNNCGRQIQNETANFCEYCGASFREQAHTAQTVAGQPFNSRPVVAGPIPTAMPNMMAGAPEGLKSEGPITFLNWLGTYALLLVPFVGWLIFIVMLFIWAFSNNTPATKKNWARVSLIFVGVLLILFVAYMIAFVAPMMQQMMNGTFDINSYYQGLSQSAQ